MKAGGNKVAGALKKQKKEHAFSTRKRGGDPIEKGGS